MSATPSGRRKEVMARSIRLGHCVCNPKEPCPCDIFRRFNVCQCAGERLPVRSGDVALTRHVRKAGCASKIGQADLGRILSGLPPVTDPRVLVGLAAGDDAGVFRLPSGERLVQTVDVFTPCVDDPYLFGRIAAANSVSDVYAMGGVPLTALSVVGFPVDELDGEIMTTMLRGAMATLAEADCVLIGGHSINDEEIKLGFAVTGVLEAGEPIERGRARPGDVLVLTKPLGTGMVSFAAQIGRVRPACLDDAGRVMATLNRDASELMRKHGAHACTDVTGFGLAGHLVEMVRQSGVVAEIDLARLPVLGAVPVCLAEGIFSGAVDRNRDYAMGWVEAADDADPELLPVLFDPQTSGGLLLALPADAVDAFVAEMRARGHDATSAFGTVEALPDGRAEGRVRVHGRTLSRLFGIQGDDAMTANERNESVAGGESAGGCCSGATPDVSAPGCCAGASATPAAEPPACCSGAAEAVPAEGAAEDVLGVFRQFLAAASAPGALDAKTKKLIAVALSISERCRPCLEIHLRGALDSGISRAELDEAANLAVAFGGGPALMFYKETLQAVVASRRSRAG